MATAQRKRKTVHRTAKQRATWRGNLTFGLVSFAVEAFSALDREHSDIHFHQLHAKCHSRIRYQKVCPIHGEVSKDEIVSGFEYKKGKYVEVEPEELDALRTESDRALKIDAFVTPETVDPLYFDGRMYYLLPDGAASQEPYAVLVEAMEREEHYGVGQLVFSGKEQIALVRPLEGLMHMAMLNYDAEIRSPKKVASSLKKPSGIARQVRLAQTLIEGWSQEDFDFAKYKDRYREEMQELIKARVEGREIVAPKEEGTPEVLNLMDALKKSLGQSGTRKRGEIKLHRRRRSA